MSSIKGKKATCFNEVTKYVSAYHVSNLTWKTPLSAMLAAFISSQAVFNVQQKTIIRQTKGKIVVSLLVCTPHSQRFTELNLSFAKCTQRCKAFYPEKH